MTVNPQIEEGWKQVLKKEFESDYFADLKRFLIDEKESYSVYPPASKIFNAYNLTPFDKVKVVILGQDPYHNPGQAHGLSFSVEGQTALPPSLKNIFKELNSDLGCPISTNGDLTPWAQQGVLLLNATLTVRKKTPGSHQKKGWESFTDASISALSDHRNHLVFLLWGNYARAKKQLIDQTKHLVLESVHPSPFAANSGFFGCKHFSKSNRFLAQNRLEPIDWSLC